MWPELLRSSRRLRHPSIHPSIVMELGEREQKWAVAALLQNSVIFGNQSSSDVMMTKVMTNTTEVAPMTANKVKEINVRRRKQEVSLIVTHARHCNGRPGAGVLPKK